NPDESGMRRSFTVDLPIALKARAFALQPGDIISVRGQIVYSSMLVKLKANDFTITRQRA
ncbi:MAG: hypothetical protein AAB214_11150, partial [Fibrobacterota bacterium]